MPDIFDSTPSSQIRTFMYRKSREYPELGLLEDWGRYEDTPYKEDVR